MKDKHHHGTLVVSGRGRVEVSPDEALVQFTIITEAKTASAAVADNAERTEAVVKAVSNEPNHGVTTGGLGVSPIMRYDPETHIGSIVGFRASNSVNVLTKVAYAGRIYDAGVEAGANQSSGISFRVQDEIPHREQALRMAVEQAHAEARVVAKAAGVKLDDPEAIHIDAGAGRLVQRAAQLEAGGPPTPVIPGDLTISAAVQLTFNTRA